MVEKRKLAIFVEGQTEILFLERFIKEIAGEHRVHIRIVSVRGKKKSKQHGKRIAQLTLESENSETTYFVLLCDCGSDKTVLSAIRNSYPGMQGTYSGILGLRDLYPTPLERKDDVMTTIEGLLPVGPLASRVILAIMEIEAWFLGEVTHYRRVDPSLTHEVACQILGFDPSEGDLEDRRQPSEDLNRLYSKAGYSYTKEKHVVTNTVELLSWERMYLELPNRLPSLKTLVDCLDDFFSGRDWRTKMD